MLLLAVIALFVRILIRRSTDTERFSHQQPLATMGGIFIFAYILMRAPPIVHLDQMLGINQ